MIDLLSPLKVLSNVNDSVELPFWIAYSLNNAFQCRCDAWPLHFAAVLLNANILILKHCQRNQTHKKKRQLPHCNIPYFIYVEKWTHPTLLTVQNNSPSHSYEQLLLSLLLTLFFILYINLPSTQSPLPSVQPLLPHESLSLSSQVILSGSCLNAYTLNVNPGVPDTTADAGVKARMAFLRCSTGHIKARA